MVQSKIDKCSVLQKETEFRSHQKCDDKIILIYIMVVAHIQVEAETDRISET
jgi:hypothetical protein